MASATTAHTHPPPNYKNPPTRQPEFLAIQITFTSVAVIIVGLRVFTRRHYRKIFGADDWVIMAATLLAIVGTVTECSGIAGGTGLHYWDVPPNVNPAFAQKVRFGLIYYLAYQGNGTLCTAFALGALFAGIFQCSPVRKTWLGHLVQGGKCFDQYLYFKLVSVINIILDFVVLLLPMPILLRLNMPWKQRIALALVFGIGLFACVSSIIRLAVWFTVSDNLRQNPDATWNRVRISDWSCIEYTTGLICASLPHLKPLIVTLIPNLFSSKTSSSETSFAPSASTGKPLLSVQRQLTPKHGPRGGRECTPCCSSRQTGAARGGMGTSGGAGASMSEIESRASECDCDNDLELGLGHPSGARTVTTAVAMHDQPRRSSYRKPSLNRYPSSSQSRPRSLSRPFSSYSHGTTRGTPGGDDDDNNNNDNAHHNKDHNDADHIDYNHYKHGEEFEDAEEDSSNTAITSGRHILVKQDVDVHISGESP
ncbi:MAG: hypothetical protein M1819_003319 [Sarea resinae]|nr:MAG: hypothetical protein M1819_003319 [Sarea resinae]